MSYPSARKPAPAGRPIPTHVHRNPEGHRADDERPQGWTTQPPVTAPSHFAVIAAWKSLSGKRWETWGR